MYVCTQKSFMNTFVQENIQFKRLQTQFLLLTIDLVGRLISPQFTEGKQFTKVLKENEK